MACRGYNQGQPIDLPEDYNMTARFNAVVQSVPPELEREATELLEELLARHPQSPPPKLKMRWAGALAHLKGQYPSGVEAAHAAVREWTEMVEKKNAR
jgi:hypothetical protein